jgi:hypothetical protein
MSRASGASAIAAWEVQKNETRRRQPNAMRRIMVLSPENEEDLILMSIIGAAVGSMDANGEGNKRAVAQIHRSATNCHQFRLSKEWCRSVQEPLGAAM